MLENNKRERESEAAKRETITYTHAHLHRRTDTGTVAETRADTVEVVLKFMQSLQPFTGLQSRFN